MKKIVLILLILLPNSILAEICKTAVETLTETSFSRNGKITSYLQFLTEFRSSAKEPWTFSHEQERSFQEIFDRDGDIFQKFEELYSRMLLARLANIQGSYGEKFFEKVLIDKDTSTSFYSRTIGRAFRLILGNHYNPILNRIATHNPETPEEKLINQFINFHRFEHAMHRNTKPMDMIMSSIFMREIIMLIPTPFFPIFRRRIESRGMGAQWEILRRVPEKYHQELTDIVTDFHPQLKTEKLSKELNIDIDKVQQTLNNLDFYIKDKFIKRNKMKKSTNEYIEEYLERGEEFSFLRPYFRKLKNLKEKRDTKPFEIFKASLDNIHKEKLDFIDSIDRVHEYDMQTLLKRHYQFGVTRIVLMSITSYLLYKGYENYQSSKDETEKDFFLYDTLSSIPFADIQIYIRSFTDVPKELEKVESHLQDKFISLRSLITSLESINQDILKFDKELIQKLNTIDELPHNEQYEVVKRRLEQLRLHNNEELKINNKEILNVKNLLSKYNLN